MRNSTAVLLLAALASPGTVAAQAIIAQLSGLTSPAQVIDFGANVLPNFTPVSNQFPGITITHASYFTTGVSNNLVGGFLTNDFSGSPNTLRIQFAVPITDLSFVYHQISTASPSNVRAVLQGVTVDSFSGTWNQYQPNNYFGFTNTVFDELQIDFVSDFNVDTLAFNPAAGSGTLATNTNLGQGCISAFASFYENFVAASGFDLANSSITMNPAAGGYVVTSGGSLAPVGSLSAATSLALSDDDSVAVGTLGLTVHSNGFVSFAPGNGNGFTPVVATLLNDPARSVRSWHDLNPSIPGSGQVKYEELGPVAHVTYDGVWDFGGSSSADANTIQFQIDTATGAVVICWGAMSGLGNGWLVGYSPAGASSDPGNSNLSDVRLGASVIVTAANDVLPLNLTSSSRPVLNTNWNLVVGNVPATAVFGVNLFGLSDPGIVDLSFLGLPGCQLRASLEVIQGPWLPAGSIHNYGLAIPNTPTLVNFHVFTQAAVWQVPAVNAFGAITSNGIDGKLGDL
ncbi:MAG TPA: hypothetical protein VFZ65_03425 [Planctomycetota bacterium]|nr:hypothetical protein [Planctomycetota bacterium]